jgi:hypothetical protein
MHINITASRSRELNNMNMPYRHRGAVNFLSGIYKAALAEIKQKRLQSRFCGDV